MVDFVKRVGDEDLSKVSPGCLYPQYEYSVKIDGEESSVVVTCNLTADVMISSIKGSAALDQSDLNEVTKAARFAAISDFQSCANLFFTNKAWDDLVWGMIKSEFRLRHDVDAESLPFCDVAGVDKFREWLQDENTDDYYRNMSIRDLIEVDRLRRAIEVFVAKVFEECGKTRTAYRMEVEYTVTGTGYVWVVADSADDARHFLMDDCSVYLEADLDVEVDRYKDEDVTFSISRYPSDEEELDVVGETAEEEWADEKRRSGDCEAVYVAPTECC